MGSRMCAQGLSLRIRHSLQLHAKGMPIAVRPALCGMQAMRAAPVRSWAPQQWIHTTVPRLDVDPSSQNKPITETKKKLSLRERASNMWSTVKYLFRFYLNGVKQIWRNRDLVKQIKVNVAETGRDLTYEEATLLYVYCN